MERVIEGDGQFTESATFFFGRGFDGPERVDLTFKFSPTASDVTAVSFQAEGGLATGELFLYASTGLRSVGDEFIIPIDFAAATTAAGTEIRAIRLVVDVFTSTGEPGTVQRTATGSYSEPLPPDPTAPIPLPAAGWLLLGGAGALAALRRRQRVA